MDYTGGLIFILLLVIGPTACAMVMLIVFIIVVELVRFIYKAIEGILNGNRKN